MYEGCLRNKSNQFDYINILKYLLTNLHKIIIIIMYIFHIALVIHKIINISHCGGPSIYQI